MKNYYCLTSEDETHHAAPVPAPGGQEEQSQASLSPHPFPERTPHTELGEEVQSSRIEHFFPGSGLGSSLASQHIKPKQMHVEEIDL